MAYSVRMAAIRELLHQPNPHLPIAETAEEIGAKAELLQRLRAGEKQGIVLKKVNGISRRGGAAVDGYTLQCAFPGAELSRRLPSVQHGAQSHPGLC
jgi:hypothetical protein